MSEFSRLAADLDRHSETLRDRASAVVRKTVFDTMADAQTLAPVDTGNLKGSITTEVRPGDLVGVVEATADYAAYIEWGTSKMQPQPFMQPAQDRNTPTFLEALATLVDEL